MSDNEELLHASETRKHYETLAEKAAREKVQKKRHIKIMKETFGEKVKEITDNIDNLILSDLMKLQDAACVSGASAEKSAVLHNVAAAKLSSASDFLSEGLRILSERGKQYDPSGTKEMSFDNVAGAFNCLTNSRLRGSDVCLILALLKVVRQNANEDFHEDSAVDFVNYAALHGELVKSEK